MSIGTLGNDEPPPAQEQDLPEFAVEEVKKLQDALERLLRRAKSKSSTRGSGADADSPPLDRFLNCPSSLEVDRRVQTKHSEGEGDLSPDTKIILTKARDLLDNRSGNIKQKSFKFLLKNMFVFNGGFFAPAPSLKDPVESRMGKLFRTVLGKKINARSGNGTAMSKKYFVEDGPKGKRRGDRRRGCQDGEGEESCRWDRTDSEFIVLEI
ncbi:protein NEGATIVE GRAVITROPIC RESPONSE OF ROOTS-like [Phragmites australis]|uniref:protein NEGATIVE GRAVITROPIC RESPONSE OF ROOTS-like n=1 Tax=Phragmites australis TaxID=29695 RepID=UPI002D7910F2|nr:protein NEGATIVE GRAVITROPIC RESPONSE OF ROOTS-like [Phragmites australis]